MAVTTIRGGRQISDSTIPYADIQNVTANALLGNNTAGATSIQEIALATNTVLGRGGSNIVALSLGTGLTISGSTLQPTANLQSLAGLSYGSSAAFVKMTAAGTFALDTTTYLSSAVTSVGLSLPNIFTVSGSPVTTTGTLTATLASQTANTVFAAPNGSAGAPAFRALVAADIPALSYQAPLNGTGYVKMSGTTVSYVASIPNGDLANSSITIQGTSVSLGGSVNIINGTGFVKASGTTLSYDNNTYSLSNHTHYIGTTAVQSSSANQALTGITGITFVAEGSDAASIVTTISSTSTFFDFNLADDNNNDEWRWRFTPSGGSIYSAMRLVPVSNTASNLIVSGTITGSQIIKSGGTSSQFLKADGSVDTNAYITGNQSISISGDASGSGTTAITLTLATVNSNVGTFNNVTVNAKGLVTAASNVSYLTGNQTITLTGNVTGSGTTSIATTIANGVVTNAMLVNSSFYIGTTQISLGRTSAAQALTGITSIDGTAVYLKFADTRNTASTPETNNASSGIQFDFKANSTNSLSDGGTFNGVMYWRKYGNTTDWSGGGALELAYTDNGNMWHRYGTSTTWNAWRRIWNSNDFTATNISNWNTAYGWGNHASAGYISGNQTITLSGDVSGSGTTSITVTLATVPVSKGGTGATTLTGILVGNGTSAVTAVAGTASQLLRRNAGNNAYEFFTPSYITGNQTITVSGDASGSGTTAITLTLATVNSNVGTFNNVTVNAKGLVTAASNVSYLTGNQTITLTGNVTGSGTTSIATTIANGVVTNAMLVNSSITVQGTSVSLGGSVNIINGTGFVKASGTTISYDNSTYLTTAANWFGAEGTGGTLDWNHVTNTRPGTGVTLLLGSATNGFGGGNYYHAFNLEYSSKDGTGNVTQLAVAYGTPANDIKMRGRYSGSWSSWVTVWTSATLTNLNQLTNGPGYITSNQSITLTGDVTGSGTTSIATTIGAGKVTNAMLVNSSFYVGTTSISLGRASAAQSLTGITSIDGYANNIRSGEITNLNTSWTDLGSSISNALQIFRYQSTASNSPEVLDNANWVMNIYSHPSGGTASYGHQISGVDSDNIYVRYVQNGSFGTWRKIWTAATLTNLNQLTNGPGYITGYTETDTLATVTARGATTSSSIQVSKTAHTAGANNYHLEVYSPDTGDSNQEVSIRFHHGNQYYAQIRYNPTGFRLTGGANLTYVPLYAANIYSNGNQVLTAESDTLATVTGRGASTTTAVSLNGQVYINNASPTVYLQDTDHRSSMIHVNSNVFYVLRGNGNNSTTWTTYNGYWPMELNLENNNATFGGNILAVYDITAYSDVRLKENIVTVENALEKVTSLRGVTYNRKDNNDGKRHLGVIAQEVEEILPEVVKEDDKGIKHVAYGNMVGVLIEAMKEQQKQIEDLKKQIEFLAENR